MYQLISELDSVSIFSPFHSFHKLEPMDILMKVSYQKSMFKNYLNVFENKIE